MPEKKQVLFDETWTELLIENRDTLQRLFR